jgi:uncharacterized oligopeptide transporter (OPT) family protein
MGASMALKQLTETQIHSMSLEEKDHWWLENIYKGDMPQLTLRSALTGMILGGVLSLTNLYVGIKTGWTLGIGITSVILAFAFFKVISKLNFGKELTLLENNAMQSIATSAGYMTAPLISSMAAYMLATRQIVPMLHTMVWIALLSLLGVLFAFPLKKRVINDEQMPFPEGRAAGIVMDGLHSDNGAEGLFKAKILAVGGGLSAVIEVMRNHAVMKAMRLSFAAIPEYWDDLIYKANVIPAIMGTPLKDLTIRFDSSIVMMATGGLMGTKVASSMLIGAICNYVCLAPYMISKGIIAGATFKAITMWSLWGGVAMMTTASLFSFFSKPKILLSSFQGIFSHKNEKVDILKDIELPMWVFPVGIPLVGGAICAMGHVYFGIHYLLGLLAIPLVFVFTLIAVNSTGLTSITPGGALAKLTQLTFAIAAPKNIATNIMAAGITGEVSLNASNLLMDIKPGYMLGAKPRQQAIGHVLGIIAGAVVAVPVFYALFGGNVDLLVSEKFPMPAASIWIAVSEVLMKGLSFLPPSARIAVGIGAVLGIVIEIANKRFRGKFPVSAMGLGLAFVIQFTDCFAMAVGAGLFWALNRKYARKEESNIKKIFCDNQETLCAGVIAGGSLIGIVLILLENFVAG